MKYYIENYYLIKFYLNTVYLQQYDYKSSLKVRYCEKNEKNKPEIERIEIKDFANYRNLQYFIKQQGLQGKLPIKKIKKSSFINTAPEI